MIKNKHNPPVTWFQPLDAQIPLAHQIASSVRHADAEHGQAGEGDLQQSGQLSLVLFMLRLKTRFR